MTRCSSSGSLPIVATSLLQVAISFQLAWAQEYSPELGVNLDPHHLVPPDTSTVAAAAVFATAGVTRFRVPFDWGTANPDPGTWNFTYLDAATNMAVALDAQLLPILSYGTRWTTDCDCPCPDCKGLGETCWSRPPTPAHMADWAAFVDSVVTRYGAHIDAYEVGNEPEHPGFFYGPVEAFQDMVAVADSVINALDPTASTVLGGLAMPAYLGTNWLGRFLDQPGGYDCFDILGFHAYAGEHLQGLALIESAFTSRSLPLKDIWVTETGCKSNPVPDNPYDPTGYSSFVHPYSQVDYVYRTLARFRHPHVKTIFWYNGWDASPNESHGLLTSDLLPKPAFSRWVN